MSARRSVCESILAVQMETCVKGAKPGYLRNCGPSDPAALRTDPAALSMFIVCFQTENRRHQPGRTCDILDAPFDSWSTE